MHAQKPTNWQPQRRISVQERILGELAGERNEALIFAAASIIKEVSAADYAGGPVAREVRTPERTYTLKGCRVASQDGSQPVVFVYSMQAAPEPSIEDRIRGCFRLTRKEARVAVLLTQQKSNEDIARELYISSHTARHHTQSVLGKLGVRSRRDVAAVLRCD